MLNVKWYKREDNVIIDYKDGRFYYFIICPGLVYQKKIKKPRLFYWKISFGYVILISLFR